MVSIEAGGECSSAEVGSAKVQKAEVRSAKANRAKATGEGAEGSAPRRVRPWRKGFEDSGVRVKCSRYRGFKGARGNKNSAI